MITRRQTSTTNLNHYVSTKVIQPTRDHSYDYYKDRRNVSQSQNFASNIYNQCSISGSNIFNIKISDCKEDELEIRVNRVNTKIFDSRVITPNRIVNSSIFSSNRSTQKVDSRNTQFNRNYLDVSIFKKQVDLSNILASSHIVSGVRAKLLNWMIEVIKNFPEKSSDYTLYRSVIILDMYLKHNRERPVDKSSIHLVGITCMYIASKYEDIYPITLNDFVHIIGYSKYSKEQIIQMEYNILKALSFLISFPAYGEFVDYYTHKVLSKYFDDINVDKINYLIHYTLLLNLHSADYGEVKMDLYVLSCVIFVLKYCEISPNINSWNHMRHEEFDKIECSINDLFSILELDITEVDRIMVKIRSNIEYFDRQYPGMENLRKYFNRYPLKIINKF